MQVNLDKQEIERDSAGQKRDRHQSGLTKRYTEIEVDRQEIETNIGGFTKNRQR